MNPVKVTQLPPMPDGVETHVVALTGRLLEVARRPGHDRRRRPPQARRQAHPQGDQLTADVSRTIAAVEQHWRQQVGAERYRAFRQVLEDLANASAETAALGRRGRNS